MIEVYQSLASRLNMLSLQPCFNDVERVGYGACNAARHACTQKVPKERVLTLPWPDCSFNVFIAADDRSCKRRVHHYSQGVAPIETSDKALFLNDVRDALPCC